MPGCWSRMSRGHLCWSGAGVLLLSARTRRREVRVCGEDQKNGGGKPGGGLVGRRKRWRRDQYPENWEEMSQAFRASKKYTCEHCGTVRGTLRFSKAGRWYRSKAVAAHRYPNDTRNPHPELLCLCERCHFAYDALFRGIIEEGEHQAILHEILLERYVEQEKEVNAMEEEAWWDRADGEANEREPAALDVPCVEVPAGVVPVCCSCGEQDASLSFGCGYCGRPVHYHEPECGGWLLDSWHDEAATEHEFWCLDCLENGLP